MIRNEALYDFLKKYVEAGCINESRRSLLSKFVEHCACLVSFYSDEDCDSDIYLEFTAIGAGLVNFLSVMKWSWQCWSVSDCSCGSKIIVRLYF